jgi:hypothetical protein
MHIDENKKFDKRNVAWNIRNGIISQKDYETFMSRLPDASSKLFNPEESSSGQIEVEPREESETSFKKKGTKKKGKGKGK